MLPSRLIVRTCCHSTCSSSPASSFRLNAPKPANPLGLKPRPSVTYLRNAACQTHFAYPACFQQFSPEKKPLLGKRVVQRSANACLSCNRYAVSWWRSRHLVTCRRTESKNIPTIQAGMSHGISSLSGKPQTGPDVNRSVTTYGCSAAVRSARRNLGIQQFGRISEDQWCQRGRRQRLTSRLITAYRRTAACAGQLELVEGERRGHSDRI